MKNIRFAIAGIILAIFTLPAAGTDSPHIDRSIAKEPVYQSKPEYCLLVFGPGMRDRVWLVIDGDVLYVDRNGDGDLTSPEKRVEAIKLPDSRVFAAGDVQLGQRRYTDLCVSRNRLSDGVGELQPEAYRELRQKGGEAFTYSVAVHVSNPLHRPQKKSTDTSPATQTASSDSHGLLQFADSPQQAPVIHFDGPLTMDIHGRPVLAAGNEINLETGIGTKGLGPGTFAFISYEMVPKAAQPRAEFDFASEKPGGESVHLKCDIRQRC